MRYHEHYNDKVTNAPLDRYTYLLIIKTMSLMFILNRMEN